MIVSAEDFIRNIGSGAAPRVVLFGPGKPPWGKEDFEPYLADRAIDQLLGAYLDPGLRDLAYTAVYADETAPGVVAEEAQTLPFLAERRVILVRKAQLYLDMATEKRSPALPLLQYLENPSDTTLLILVASEVDKRKRLYKLIESNGVIVECPQLGDAALGAWIRKQVKVKGCSITQDAIDALLERVGSRLTDMANALELVSNFVSAGGQITEADVQSACGNVAESTVWELTNAIAASNSAKALEALHALLSMSIAPDEILGTINWLLESAYKALPETKASGNKPFVEKKVAPLAAKFGLQRIIAALAFCTRTQFATRTTGADRELLLELLVIKLSESNKSGPKR